MSKSESSQIPASLSEGIEALKERFSILSVEGESEGSNDGRAEYEGAGVIVGRFVGSMDGKLEGALDGIEVGTEETVGSNEA